MTDMQTSLPLLIVRPYILNPVIPLTGETKCPTSHTFASRIPFHPLKCWCHTSTNFHQDFLSSSWVNTCLDLPRVIWSTSYHHVTLLVDKYQLSLLLTIALVYRRQVFAQASPPHAVCSFKASNLPFTLATSLSTQSLVLIFSIKPHDSMSCLICNEYLHHTIWA